MAGIQQVNAIPDAALLQLQAISGQKQIAPVKTGNFSGTLNQKLNAPSSLDSIFAEASRKYDVPVSLLKAVAKAESDFNPKAVSHAGAQGVMQLMPATARELGVTDSFDPYQNIMGGAKYLSTMLNRYDGNAKLALAAYNAGSNNVDKYGGIPPFKETQNYVVKVMNYAGSDISATIPASSRSASVTPTRQSKVADTPVIYNQTPYYQNILQNVQQFDSFTQDDYILFLEFIKSSLQTSSLRDFSDDNTNSSIWNSLYGDRFQTLY